MRKTTFLKNLFFECCLLVLLCSGQMNAQIVIGAPNLGFSQACASASFNTYNVTFVFSPASGLGANNQFRVELSDAIGSFATPTTVFTSNAGAVTVSPATLNFQLPTTTSGEGYKIRIKSSAPVATSSNSVAFAAYYKLQDSPFSINHLVSTGAYCSGGSYLLAIDNPGTGDNDSPLNYPSLTYDWFKETSPTTSVFVSSGPTLTVNQEGTYFVKTIYGTCTSDSFSNRVAITEVSSGEANATIVSSLGNPFCPSEGATTLSTLGGVSYQWFKDGVAIAGATEQMYQTVENGTYSVQVDLGSCQASGTFDLETGDFISGLNVEAMNTMEVGETLTVRVATTASNPEFEWYLNGSLLSNSSNTYNATEFGDYKVVVFQTSGCIVSRELLFSINEPIEQFPDVANIPNLISPNGD
ncbi:MAG: gliding motility-associated C-terminal domain-containing protein, partial [Aquaticitalea sp.]